MNITDRLLKTTVGAHSPFSSNPLPNIYVAATLAACTCGALLTIYLTVSLVKSEDSGESKGSISVFWGSRLKKLYPDGAWLNMIPAALAAAIALSTLFKGIFHMPSLVVFAMLSVSPPI